MRAPHGGSFVLFALNNIWMFSIALIIAGVSTAAVLVLLIQDVINEDDELVSSLNT